MPQAAAATAPSRSFASRALSIASIVALVLALLFFIGAAGASIDGPAAVRGMAIYGGTLLSLAIALKVAAAEIERRRSRANTKSDKL